MKYLVDVNGERVTVELVGDHVRVGGTLMDISLLAIEGTPVHLVRVGDRIHRVVARRGVTRGTWQLDLDGARRSRPSGRFPVRRWTRGPS